MNLIIFAMSNGPFSPSTVIASDFQLQGIFENCCNTESSGIFCIDTTFNFGEFYLTTTPFKQPAMIHIHQDENQFYYCSQTLTELEKDIDHIIAWGGGVADRERAMVNGLGGCLPVATVLACTRHVEHNCAQKMSELGISAAARNELLQDIFKSEAKKEKV